jgi:hypothetical protein
MPTKTPFNYLSLPITRRRDNTPMTETVRTINRSDCVRKIFQIFGVDVSTNKVHTELLKGGLKVSDTLIVGLRNKAKAEAAKAATKRK